MATDGGPTWDTAAPGRAVSTCPGAGALPRVEAIKDEHVRRWDVVTPSATQIGRPQHPQDDIDENLRRLHDEQHPAMQDHSGRMHRLDKARITHALCSDLGVTPWERDRALGIMTELDLTAFGSQRAIPKIALVVLRHVVDTARKHRLGLHDEEWVAAQSPARLEQLYERFESLTEEEGYRALLEEYDLDTTSVNRLTRTLREQLDEQDLRGAAFGRSPFRDPSLPAFTDRSTASERESSSSNST